MIAWAGQKRLEYQKGQTFYLLTLDVTLESLLTQHLNSHYQPICVIMQVESYLPLPSKVISKFLKVWTLLLDRKDENPKPLCQRSSSNEGGDANSES